ncbi:ferrochelatase [Oleiphilus messinensis]|uniref:Ferrochelatase n=1 Tax=Oleiphilus messinensis TaxID=141451 RepID=A0A1Y0IAS8_9GAMM|nr:Wadjet anti-phage system protein JetA family protein [Oleiphilus messinensis]ARU56575.1 ferrochelatase [Oleiphilus messinensis]
MISKTKSEQYSESHRFFSNDRNAMFRPLNGKYREVTVTCMKLLYRRLYSSMADYGHALTREQLLEIFLEALARNPDWELDGDSDTDLQGPKSNRETALHLLNQLSDYGWLEIQVDEVNLSSRYHFTRAGRLFTQCFVELEGKNVRTRHRNTRNTRNALTAFASTHEVYDLLDAFEFSERIISDFTDVITELEERKRLLVHDMEVTQLIQRASDEFFEFMERRFQPDVAVRLSADSVEKHRDEIVILLGRIRRLPKANKVAAERKLRELLPDQVVENQSLLWFILEQIEQRVINACEIMLPALRESLRNFTRRADIIIRQMTFLASQRNHDVSSVCKALCHLDSPEQSRRLEVAAEIMSPLSITLQDPKQMQLREYRVVEPVNTLMEADVDVDEYDRRELFIQNALDQAFTLHDENSRKYLESQLREGQMITNDKLPITSARELLAAVNLVGLAATNTRSSEYQFEIHPTGNSVSTDYLTCTDQFTIRLSKKD